DVTKSLLELGVTQPLGIIESHQLIGWAENGCEGIYYDLKQQNKYLGTLRLLAEVLHDYDIVPQDFTVMVPNYDLHGLENLKSYLKLPAPDVFDHLKTDYPDFALFFEEVSELLDFDTVIEERDIEEFQKLAAASFGFPGELAFAKHLLGQVELGRKNAKVLELTRSLPKFMVGRL
ncbi:MAG TPA: hypothetical protein PLX66_03170, partial [Bacilli bacterium]|nr:hypothetical protein [Bacilli bacterium]